LTDEANYGLSQSGKVELGLFAFNSLSIKSGVTVKVQGNRGLVLASRGPLSFAGTISLNGIEGTSGSTSGQPTGVGGLGGSGAEGGVRKTSWSSLGLNSDYGAGGLRTSSGHGVGYGGDTVTQGRK